MRDWRAIADNVIKSHSKMDTVEGRWRLCLDAEQLSIAFAAALDNAHLQGQYDPNVSYGPAPGKPVLVNDKWLEDLNNKIAQINQRLNVVEGVQRGFGDIVTKQEPRLQAVEKRADEHRRLIDNVDKQLVAVEQSTKACRDWISRQLNPMEDKIMVADLTRDEPKEGA